MRQAPGRIIGVSVDANGQPGVPDGAADARAAHPPREGDVEHLHGAGAARQHGGDVRRLSRPDGAEGHRDARPHAGAHRSSTRWRARATGRSTSCISTRCGSTPPAAGATAAAVGSAALAARHQLPVCRRRRPIGIALDETCGTADVAQTSLAVFASAGGEQPAPALDASAAGGPPCRSVPGAAWPHERLPDASGVQHASLRNAR